MANSSVALERIIQNARQGMLSIEELREALSQGYKDIDRINKAINELQNRSFVSLS